MKINYDHQEDIFGKANEREINSGSRKSVIKMRIPLAESKNNIFTDEIFESL